MDKDIIEKLEDDLHNFKSIMLELGLLCSRLEGNLNRVKEKDRLLGVEAEVLRFEK